MHDSVYVSLGSILFTLFITYPSIRVSVLCNIFCLSRGTTLVANIRHVRAYHDTKFTAPDFSVYEVLNQQINSTG